jgi:preprotein translocase subunit SecD
LHTAKSEIEVHQRSQRGIWGAASVVAFFPIHYRKPEIVVSIAVM